MKNAATKRRKGIQNQPWSGGKPAENEKKMLFRRNEPKVLLKIKRLAFLGAQNELLFECKKCPSKRKSWPKTHALRGLFFTVGAKISRRIFWGARVIWHRDPLEPPVIPAKAGIQSGDRTFPKVCRVDSAFAGMTRSRK
jgi:hypothetical protein